MNRREWLAAAALAAAACNRNSKRQIGVIPKGRTHIFWQSVHAGAVKASREKDVEIIWNGPASETEFTGQIQIIDAMINRRVDALALAPIDSKAMVSAVERAAAAKIPVVIFDSGIDTEKFVAQVSTDNYAGGALAAERMGQILGGKGKVVIVAVQAGSASTVARESGFEQTIAKKFPGIQIVDKRYGNADYAQSRKVAENMLTANPDLAGVFASNESSSAGASQAVKAAGAKVKMVGFDASDALVEDLKAGVIDALVLQHPFKMGYQAVLAAVQALGGEQQMRMQNIEPGLATRENLASAEIQERINPDLKRYL
jgi:ribose transport system substrate-binding protein